MRLGDVAEANRSGWSPSDDATILYLDLTSIVVPGILSCPKELAAAEAPSRARRRVHSGDILVSTVRPNLRGFARVREAPKNLIASTGFAVLTPMSDVDGSYVYHHVMTQLFADYLEKTTTGQAYPAVRPSDVTDYVLPIPPLPEQRAIAAVLDSIDDAIEGSNAVIAATEQLRGSLLQELLTRGVPGWHREWKEAPGLGTIPVGWEVVRLGDILESTNYGTNAQLGRDGDVTVLRMNNLQNGEIDLSDVRRASLSEKEGRQLNLVPGDILFNRTNSLDLVGKVAVVRSLPDRVSFASYLIRLRTVPTRANPFWLNALLWSSDCQSRIRKFATPGVSQANVNPTSLKSLAIPLPSLPEQQAIAGLLDGVDVAIGQAKHETNMLKLLKESTADALLTGRVRVGGG